MEKERFELITICHDKTFYELERIESDMEDLKNELIIDNTHYVFPPYSNLFVEELQDSEIYTICYIDKLDKDEQKLYENLSKKDVLKFVGSLGSDEKVYANIFKLNDKINAIQYFGIL